MAQEHSLLSLHEATSGMEPTNATCPAVTGTPAAIETTTTGARASVVRIAELCAPTEASARCRESHRFPGERGSPKSAVRGPCRRSDLPARLLPRPGRRCGGVRRRRPGARSGGSRRPTVLLLPRRPPTRAAAGLGRLGASARTKEAPVALAQLRLCCAALHSSLVRSGRRWPLASPSRRPQLGPPPSVACQLASASGPRRQKNMAQETNQTPGPMLCSTGCGFYGNPRTNGMCTVCYKEHLQSQQNSGRMSPMGTASGSNSPTSDSASVQRADASLNNCEGAARSTSEKSRNVPVATLPVTQQMTEMSISREDKITTPKTEVSEPVVSQPSSSQSEEKAPELPKPKKNRCFTCRKKVGLIGFDCRCGNMFCAYHRYSDRHNCPYDYKAEGAAKIRRENPLVVAEKIQKI